MAEKQYWYRGCEFCRQGRLFIYRLKSTGRMLLYCEECENAWMDPAKIGEIEQREFAAEWDCDFFPTLDEIEVAGWREFALHEEIQ